MPVLTAVFLIVTLAALGLPGLNSFAGEFMTLLGAWGFSPWLAVVGAAGLLLAPVYMLRLFQGAMYGPPREAAAADIAPGELALITPLVLLMFVLGFFPYALTRAMAALGQGMPPWQ
jgi:NADH-quinone oxidoreductase subunit M